MAKQTLSDFQCECHGSIFLVRPLTERAEIWAEELLPADALRFGDAIVVEHRFIADILDGMVDDGMEVQ